MRVLGIGLMRRTPAPSQGTSRTTEPRNPIDYAVTALSLGVAAATAASAIFGTTRTPPTLPAAPLVDPLDEAPAPLVRLDPPPLPSTVYEATPMRVPRPQGAARIETPSPPRTATLDVSQLVIASRAAEHLAASILVPPPGQQAVALARTFAGMPSAELRGKLLHFRAAGGATNNCADFVSSVLRGTGLLSAHYTWVPSLEQGLKAEGYVRVPSSQALPGDVWIDEERTHTQLVASAGAVSLIGSNNGGRAWQTVSEGAGGGGIIYQKR